MNIKKRSESTLHSFMTDWPNAKLHVLAATHMHSGRRLSVCQRFQLSQNLFLTWSGMGHRPKTDDQEAEIQAIFSEQCLTLRLATLYWMPAATSKQPPNFWVSLHHRTNSSETVTHITHFQVYKLPLHYQPCSQRNSPCHYPVFHLAL